MSEIVGEDYTRTAAVWKSRGNACARRRRDTGDGSAARQNRRHPSRHGSDYRHDAHLHAIQQAARTSHGVLTEAGDANSIRNIFLTQATDAAVRSKQTAETLDGAVEALERLAAG